MKITVCIGSSCHLKGSRRIIERLQAVIAEHNLQDKVVMAGQFCMGDCMNGVCLTVDDVKFSLKPENVDTFFQEQVLAKV